MIFYCDTSLLVAVFVVERNSAIARAWIGQQEASSLNQRLGRCRGRERLGAEAAVKSLSGSERARAQRVWSTSFATRVVDIDIKPEDYRRAAALVDTGRRGLRAADALHLAIAERHGLAMATLDVDLRDAADAIGLDAPLILTVP